MGISVQSKRRKRLQAARRNHLKEMVLNRELEDKHEALLKIARGEGPTKHVAPPNAFLHPDNPAAKIPTKTIEQPLDFRLAVAKIPR